MRGYYQIGARESRAASSMERSAFREWNLSGKRWLTLPIRICLALGLLLCIYLAGRRGIGDWYSRQGSPASIQTAIKWDRDNPEYYDALGTLTHFYAVTGNLSESVQFYESATRLSPYDAHFWSDLGAAYDWAGRPDDALNAFQRALRLFPNSPEINWRFANFNFRTHRIPEGLRALQVVLAGNSPAHRDVFLLATTATRDNSAILEMLPWLRLLQLKLPFDLRLAFPYLDALIQHREPDRLVAAWSALSERFAAQIGPLLTSANLIANGSFEYDILNGGLDWRVLPVEGAVVSMDSRDPFEGARTLRIEFDGARNLDYGHVFQYVPVQPNTRYRFSGSIRVKGITTDSGPRFQVFDAFNMGKLFLSSENIVGTASWSWQQFEFKTADTHLLVVRVARPPSNKFDNQIAGVVWIDRVSLVPEN